MTATDPQKQQHKPGGALQRHHIEISIISVSGYRLCAALCSSKDGAVAAAAVSAVYIAALLLEFGATKLGVPYRLRRSASHGLAQGVLAVPSVLAALVAAAPTDGWQPWLQGSCAAAFAVLGVVWLQSPGRSLLAAGHTGCKSAQPANGQLHHSNGGQGEADNKAAAKPSLSPSPVAVKSGRASVAAALPSLLAAAVLLCAVALATSKHQQQLPSFNTPQQEQLLVMLGVVSSHIAAVLPLLVWACVAAASFCLSLQLLPGCFSIGEAALMAQGVTCLIITAAAALPHAALFVPEVVCWQLPHRVLLAVQGVGGCTKEAHSAAVSLQGLPAVISLVLAAAVAACLLLRVLYQSARQLRQQLTPHATSTLRPTSQDDPSQPRNVTSTPQLQQSPQRVVLNSSSSSSIQEAALSRKSRRGANLACAAAGCSAAVALAAAAGICVVLLWLCCAAAWTLLEFLPAEAGRLGVLLYWVGLLASTLPALKWLARAGNMPQIIVRKVYHLLAMGLFVPVFFWDLQLLALSLAIAFAVLVLLEVLRCTRLPLLGQSVQDFMQAFVDERDTGVIYITHFTLLLGLAVPMWLCLVMPGAQVLLDPHPHPLLPQSSTGSLSSYPGGQKGGSLGSSSGIDAPGSAAARLAAAAYALLGHSRVGWANTAAALFQVTAGLSGLVIIGVGDTAASFVGKLFGRVPVHAGSSKTVEGTLAGVAASVCAWMLLLWTVQLLPGVGTARGVAWWLQLLGATAGAGLMEAATSQLDNILLPLWYLPHLLLAC